MPYYHNIPRDAPPATARKGKFFGYPDVLRYKDSALPAILLYIVLSMLIAAVEYVIFVKYMSENPFKYAGQVGKALYFG